METIRNLKYTFRKNPAPLSLSLIGIVMAFCAFIIITTQVQFEKDFDRFHPNADCIYRVDQNDATFRSIFPLGFAEAVIHSSKHIEAGTVLCPFVGELFVTLTDEESVQSFKTEANLVSDGFFDVFGIHILEGNSLCIKEGQVAIPQSMARKWFANESPIGKEIKVNNGYFIQSPTWTIGAVYQDIPNNSQLRNQLLFPFPADMITNFSSSNFLCYVRIDDAENQSLVVDEFNKRFDFSKHNNLHSIQLLPLPEVYFQEETADSRIFRSGSRLQVYIMTVISFMILLIGFLNFTNFYTSLMPSRLHTVNTKKVLGESELVLRLEIMGETVLLLILAAIIAIILANPISEFLHQHDIVQETYQLHTYGTITLITIIVAAIGGLVSGIYPAFFATSFPLMKALKGDFTQTLAGKNIKTTLVVIQYVISCVLMVFVLFVLLQNRMMSHADLKFDKDQVAVVELTKKMTKEKGSWLQEELKQNPMVEEVAYASEIVGSQDTYCTEGFSYQGRQFSSFLIYTTPEFLMVMGIDVLEGRGFTPQSKNEFIFNRNAQEMYDLQLGTLPAKKADLVGFCENVKFTSFRNEQSPIAFRYLPVDFGFTPIVYVRLHAGFNALEAVSYIKETIAKIDSSYPTEVQFYDDILQQQYRRETRFSRILVCFSVLAIVLSLIGVFSMVIFDVQHRRKEIALSKVFGADYQEVIWLGNKPYFRIVLIGFLLAVPISWFIVTGYLESFTRHVAISVWEFLVVLILLEVITALLVVWRYHAIAKENPKDSLMA